MPRFMRKGITKFYYVPTIASATLAPTALEVTAGDNLTGQIAEVNGFTFANEPIETPDMDSTYPPQITGEDSAEESSLVFYELRGTNDIYTALPKGTVGFICIFYDGLVGAAPAAADKCDVWPIIVASLARQYTAANEAAKYQAVFAITAVPGFSKALT